MSRRQRLAGSGTAWRDRSRLLAFALSLAMAAATAPGLAAEAGEVPGAMTGSMILEDFAHYDIGTFPSRWKARGTEREARAIYRVSEDPEGGRFLAAQAAGTSVMIGLEQTFEPSAYPYLSWRWRVRTLPSGGDERTSATNDSAAGVYVVFPGRFPLLPRVLKYVWSTMAPVGLRRPSPVYDATKIIVLASGPATAPAQWITETVNVRADYEALFGGQAPAAKGIGLLTDGNDTNTLAAADYRDFRLSATAGETPPGSRIGPVAARSVSDSGGRAEATR